MSSGIGESRAFHILNISTETNGSESGSRQTLFAGIVSTGDSGSSDFKALQHGGTNLGLGERSCRCEVSEDGGYIQYPGHWKRIGIQERRVLCTWGLFARRI